MELLGPFSRCRHYTASRCVRAESLPGAGVMPFGREAVQGVSVQS